MKERTQSWNRFCLRKLFTYFYLLAFEYLISVNGTPNLVGESPYCHRRPQHVASDLRHCRFRSRRPHPPVSIDPATLPHRRPPTLGGCGAAPSDVGLSSPPRHRRARPGRRRTRSRTLASRPRLILMPPFLSFVTKSSWPCWIPTDCAASAGRSLRVLGWIGVLQDWGHYQVCMLRGIHWLWRNFSWPVLKCAEFLQAVEGVACVLGECGWRGSGAPELHANCSVRKVWEFCRACWRWGLEAWRCRTCGASGHREGQRSGMEVQLRSALCLCTCVAWLCHWLWLALCSFDTKFSFSPIKWTETVFHGATDEIALCLIELW